MRGVIWVAAALLMSSAPAMGQSPETFGAAKKLLSDIHDDIGHLETLYCGCPYTRKGRSGGDIDRDACGLETRKNDERSDRVEWEHVVPASWLGRGRACWSEGHELCVKSDGTPFKGRECCTKRGVDPAFMAAHNDPYNLFPAGGEVNGDRSAYPYGTVEGELREYGSCDFEVGGEPKVVEPADNVRGEIARAMRYMADRYAADVGMAHDDLLKWHEADPPAGWERDRAKRIRAETGLENPYIEVGEAAHGVPLFPSARSFTSEGRQGFVRIINHASEGGTVRIDAFDDDGMQYGPLTLEIGAGETVHFNSGDLEQGNVDKGLTGATGTGEGSWRLALTSTLDIEVLSYLRTHDGFVTSMHDLVPRTEAGYRVPIFNRGSNTRVSQLRVINPGAETAEVTIEGVDDAGESPGGAVRLSVPGVAARTLTSRALETGDGEGLSGALGAGVGKWRLIVTSDRSIQVMSLLSSPAGHLTNLSTVPVGVARDTHYWGQSW